jgi:hypothetical protein
MKPMSCKLFAQLYFCEAEWEPDGANCVHIWEPLDVDLPEDAKPHCCLVNEIQFWDKTGNKNLLAHNARHHDIAGCIVYLHGTSTWWKVASGTCVYRNGRWYMRWWAHKHDRESKMMNEGWIAYHN